MSKGFIHSFESMGLVDGPGIRFVVFFQGCSLRCSFCHNPDTWEFNAGMKISPETLMAKIVRFRPYFERSGGGVTFSGGEPLMQYEFLVDMLRLCKESGIHTAIDTAGIGPSDCRKALELADLILLDIKHINDEGYKSITGAEMTAFRRFVEQLKEVQPDVWLRAVIVPGINDNLDYIKDLWSFAKKIPRVQKFELLPYHTLGVNKYEHLGIEYPLADVMPMDRSIVQEWQDMLNKVLIAKN